VWWDDEVGRGRRLFANRLRQIGHRDFAAFRDQHRALDRILELANVAWPAVANQQV